MDWTTIFSGPITIGTLLAVAVGLQKMGLNVVGTMQTLFGTQPTVSLNRNAELGVRNDMQTLLMQMETLSLHFNHETTDMQNRIEEKQDRILGKIDDHIRMHDRTNFLLEEIRTNGIKCRKE